MNLECPQCSSPISQNGQRFCNRCGVDLRGFYEARGIALPPSTDVPSGQVADDKGEMTTLEMKLPVSSPAPAPAGVNPAPNGNPPAEPNPEANPGLPVDSNRVEQQPFSHTIAIPMPDITVE